MALAPCHASGRRFPRCPGGLVDLIDAQLPSLTLPCLPCFLSVFSTPETLDRAVAPRSRRRAPR